MGPILIFFFYGYLSTLFCLPLAKKAGLDTKKMLIPFYNSILLAKLVEKPPYWGILCYIPVTNVFIMLSLYIELVKAFDQYDFKPQILTMLFPFVYLPYLGKQENVVFKGVNTKKLKRGIIREWSDAIAFAVIAATIIRWSTLEAFQIPTASMEGTMLEGDFLFVSKMTYGTRSPITPLQAPFTHRYFWGTANEQGHDGIKSFSSLIQMPYFRLPGWTTVKNDDIVVFNYPAEIEPGDSFEDKILANKDKSGFGSDVPVDLRNNYVKRCVGIHGDSLHIEKGVLYINGKKAPYHDHQQTGYFVKKELSFQTPTIEDLGKQVNQKLSPDDYVQVQYEYFNQFEHYSLIEREIEKLRKKGISLSKSDLHFVSASDKSIQSLRNKFNLKTPKLNEDQIYIAGYFVNLSDDEVATFRKKLGKSYKQITKTDTLPKGGEFTKSSKPNEFGKFNHGLFFNKDVALQTQELKSYNKDNILNAIWIPEKGKTVKLDARNSAMYFRVIKYYDWNDPKSVQIKNSKITIDGKVISEYTFKQNYYFMMGDNRHNSSDSRYFGFVPEDHIVGTPLLVWMSLDPYKKGISKIRWDRLLKFVD